MQYMQCRNVLFFMIDAGALLLEKIQPLKQNPSETAGLRDNV